MAGTALRGDASDSEPTGQGATAGGQEESALAHQYRESQAATRATRRSKFFPALLLDLLQPETGLISHVFDLAVGSWCRTATVTGGGSRPA